MKKTNLFQEGFTILVPGVSEMHNVVFDAVGGRQTKKVCYYWMHLSSIGIGIYYDLMSWSLLLPQASFHGSRNHGNFT